MSACHLDPNPLITDHKTKWMFEKEQKHRVNMRILYQLAYRAVQAVTSGVVLPE